MIKDQFGQLVFSEDDVVDLIMTGIEPDRLAGIQVDETVNIETAITILDHAPAMISYNTMVNKTVEEFDNDCQAVWHMPEEYKDLDVAEYVLSLCTTQDQLQRAGKELLLFQERNLFELLKYLKYLVDIMKENHVIWGVGRGSSVASYVLYLLGIHKIDSMFYDLDPEEFLR
jgi:DNA polymerase III alpha subunit